MMKYFNIQLKKAVRFFPYLLLVTVVLFVGLALILGGILSSNSQKLENQTFNIGVSGDTENEFLQMGMAAFQTLDETRFSLAFIEMGESEAQDALASGDISAYIVLPENFVESAIAGKIDPIEFVTTAELSDIKTVFKNEITRAVTGFVVASQKGTYGIHDALSDNGYRQLANKHLTPVSIEYVDLILKRDKTLTVDELGISSGLTTAEYYICSIAILFIMLAGLPFACICCKKDNALSVLLVSKGTSYFSQLLAEYVAHLLSLIALLAFVFAGIATLPSLMGMELFSVDLLLSLFLHILPTVMMLAAFNVMLFELSSNIISGILSHFFFTLSLCYISGCFYPLYSFPKIVQNVARVLPVDVAREHMATFFTGDSAFTKTAFVLLYGILFLTIAFLGKFLKTIMHTGGSMNAKTA